MTPTNILFSTALLSTGISLALAASPPLCPPQKAADRAVGGELDDVLQDLQVTADGGFICVGDHRQPGNTASDVWVVKGNASGAMVWERSFGGSAADIGKVVISTRDGGYAIGATSWSGTGGTKTTENFGAQDFWLIQLDADGNKLWEKSFGGSRVDELRSIVQTSDGGFLLGGDSSSPASGTKTSPYHDGTPYGADFWIVRTDALGNKLWEQSYGGLQEDYLGQIAATGDGGFLLAGSSRSGRSGSKTVEAIGGYDYWIVRIDSAGAILWQQTYGGAGLDYLQCAATTADGGFVLGGDSQSEPGPSKTGALFGYLDSWLIRVDTNGSRIWDASFGGQNYESAASIRQLNDGGFIVGGVSDSPPGGNKTSPWRGGTDYWAVRLDAAGEKLWENSYGGLREDTCRQVQLLPNGGFLLAGTSTSPKRSNKSSPLLGGADFWLVQLAPEKPGDCDGDGIPDSSDACPDTPFRDLIDARGCGLAQACPCDGHWATRDAYRSCIESETANLLAAGIISSAQRQELIAAAIAADCPPAPASALVFGLTNVVLGDAVFNRRGATEQELSVTEIGPGGIDGASLQLGQADSGVFLSPYASIWGSFSENWFMDGKAYGWVDGAPGRLVSTMRARKPYYETYPVQIDLSPLNPVSVTFQVWSNSVLVAERTVPEAGGEVIVRSSATLGPRANPFWRMPDGSVGAMIEFTEFTFPGNTSTVDGPFGDGIIGDQIFIRANSPSNSVDYLSRLDVVVGGGLDAFSFLDERPGVFQRAHRVLGSGVLLPSLGRLQITAAAPAGLYGASEPFGVLVELRDRNRLNLTFEPIALTNEQAQFTASFSGWGTDANDALGSLVFLHEDGSNATHSFVVTPTLKSAGDPLEIRAYRGGVLQGISLSTNDSAIGTLRGTSNESPRIVGTGVSLASTSGIITASFTLDRAASFVAVDGREFQADHFRISATNQIFSPRTLSTVAVTVSKVPTFAITNEDENLTPPPLGISIDGGSFVLTWPSRNLPLVLESSAFLPGEFTRLPADSIFRDGRFQVRVPATSTGSQFFRLRAIP